jgi:hypothetical protein
LKGKRCIILCLAIIGLLVLAPDQAYSTTHPYDGTGGQIAPASSSRVVSIPVKLVFVGIDPATVDLSYSKWNFNTPTTIYGQVLSPQPYLTGVAYKIDYSYTFASNAYKAKLISYLQSIQVIKNRANPWFYYYTQDQSGYISKGFHSMNYVVYDANQVENWIYNNQKDLGGFPSNGWTLMLLNLTELPSYDFQDYRDFLNSLRYGSPNGTAHYFDVGYRDADLGYQWQNLGEFMSGWGGVHRVWFDDLSAGPCDVTYPEELPLQIALKDSNYDLHSSYGKQWFTEYLADYVSQATLNLITPALLYEPVYSQSYSFHVHVFDNRTSAEKGGVDIRSTVNPDMISKAFQDLLPYSKVDVSVTFEDLPKYPTLQAIVHSSYKYADSFTFGVDLGSPQRYGTVDVRPIYQYFQDNIKVFEPTYRRDRSEFMVPIFAFAFSNQTNMAFTYKWLIEPFGGVALGDSAFVANSQFDFLKGEQVSPREPNKGLGFTHDVIHEAGHMLGLPHPFDFGPVGNFILTPMSYDTWDYSFGQADKDALRRAHVDSIYLGVQSMMNQLAQGGGDVSPIWNQLKDVDAKYSQMNFDAALESVLKADSIANTMLSRTSAGVIQQPVIVGTALGLVMGFVILWLLLNMKIRISNRKSRRPRRSIGR